MRVPLTDGEVDLDSGEVVRGGRAVRLSTTERDLLAYLAARPGRAVSRDVLHQEVWGFARTIASRAADLAVLRLRRKLEQVPSIPRHLVTEQAGYSFRAATPLGEPAPVGVVTLVVALPEEIDEDRWLLTCTGATEHVGGYLVELAPDRAVAAFSDPEAARAWAARVSEIGRIGLSSGHTRALTDPRTGRTLYGGETLHVATGLARMAHRGQVLAPSEGNAGPLLGSFPILPGRQVDVVLLEGSGPSAPPPPSARRTNLAGRFDGFVDRPIERAAVAAAVSHGGAIAVVGPPGAGKTRLVEVVVGEADPPGGSWFVDAGVLSTASDVARGILRAIGASVDGDEDAVMRRMGDALAMRPHTVVVIDGADRAEEALRDRLPSWATAAPAVTWVITSRHWGGRAAVVEIDRMTVEEAIALLRTRCSTPCSAALARDLVERLEGLPLAVELAAARVRILGLEGLLGRLDRPLDCLGGEGSTMRTAIESSWELLDRWGREGLVRASAFAGPFGAAEAEAVLSSDDPGAPWFVDVLHGLSVRHLLRTREPADRPGDRTFSLPAAVRAYAVEQAPTLPGVLDEAIRRHALQVAALIDRIPWIGSPGFDDRVLPDALLAAGRTADPVVAAKCALVALASAETLSDSEAAVARSEPLLSAVGEELRGRLRLTRGLIAWRLGQPGTARIEADEAIRLGGPDALVGATAVFVGVLERSSGNAARCEEELARAEEAFVRAGYASGVSLVRLQRAMGLEKRGERAQAVEIARALAADPAAHEWHGLAFGLLGTLLFALGSPSDGLIWIERALAWFEARGQRLSVANAHALRGGMQLALSQPALADASFRAAAQAYGELGAVDSMLVFHLKIASYALADDRVEEARQTLDAAAGLLARVTEPRSLGGYHAMRCEERGRSGDRAGTDAAEREAANALGISGDRLAWCRFEVHRGMGRLALGDHDAAERALADAEAGAAECELGPMAVLSGEIRRLRRALLRRR